MSKHHILPELVRPHEGDFIDAPEPDVTPSRWWPLAWLAAILVGVAVWAAAIAWAVEKIA